MDINWVVSLLGNRLIQSPPYSLVVCCLTVGRFLSALSLFLDFIYSTNQRDVKDFEVTDNYLSTEETL